MGLTGALSTPWLRAVPETTPAAPSASAPPASAEGLKHLNTYSQAYGETKGKAEVDPARDLPRYPAVPVEQAIATWKVKPGFALELAAHEPQVRDPIAVTFDERGRMFVCEMIDYSEQRDRSPHLGRVSLLEDLDGDGRYEKSTVFADNLPWPTGLIWAGGALFVGATPDIWRLEDRDGDGRAEIREKVFTGFGTGMARLNVQALFNSFQWGPDNRIHLASGLGNRGLIRSLRRADLPAEEIAGRNFWFDPQTYEFGFEAGGAQYGMSFNNYGDRFGCSNSDHLQYWVYDERYAQRNPLYPAAGSRVSIAADGGAAEVFRLSPDEPWRIVRTRWRIGGVVKGVVEGGGRVSGYFTGATGTTVYRGDAYGPDFENNTFTGDAGGQLVHRKRLTPDGVSWVGRRPADESQTEFAASNDTWVRVVNFANAPDGTLYICDMYREVIEHPWSIPEEIKKHLDLNSGNDRGRIYRVVPVNAPWQRRTRVNLADLSTTELVATLSHPNGWHRDTASRLLCERHDPAALPLLKSVVAAGPSPLAALHALGVLARLNALDESSLAAGLESTDAYVRARAVRLTEDGLSRSRLSPALAARVARLADDAAPRVRFQLAFSLPALLETAGEGAAATVLRSAYVKLAQRPDLDAWQSLALLSGPPERVTGDLLPGFLAQPERAHRAVGLVASLIEQSAALPRDSGYAALIEFLSRPDAQAPWLQAFGVGLKRVNRTLEQVDTGGRLAGVWTRAERTAADGTAATRLRVEAIGLLAVAPYQRARLTLRPLLATSSAEEVQDAVLEALAGYAEPEVAGDLLEGWPSYSEPTRRKVLAACLGREDRALALLAAVQARRIAPDDLGAANLQALVRHPTPTVAQRAAVVLAGSLPPSRAAVLARFAPAAGLAGDGEKGRAVYLGRCSICHRAAGVGQELGPDLVTVKSRGRDGLLTAIIDPNQEVAPQYIAYDVATKDGRAFTGVVARDDATTLTLRIMGGAEVALPRAALKGSSSTGQSLMPEGLEAGLSVQDMADLLTFIEHLGNDGRGSESPSGPAPSVGSVLGKRRAERLEELKKPDGWLSLVGLHFLAPGESTAGRERDNRIVLAAGPAHLGNFTLDTNGLVRFRPHRGLPITADGRPISEEITLRSDHGGATPTELSTGTLRVLLVERTGKLALRVKDSAAPTRTGFRGLEYFPDDPSWRIEATWEPWAQPRELSTDLVIGGREQVMSPGQAVFTREGRTFKLLAIDEGPEEPLFFVFSDETSGGESYGLRHLDAARPVDGRIVLDFNLAKNPPCAFTTFSTCALPPAQNRLAVPVRAGEKIYRAEAP